MYPGGQTMQWDSWQPDVPCLRDREGWLLVNTFLIPICLLDQIWVSLRRTARLSFRHSGRCIWDGHEDSAGDVPTSVYAHVLVYAYPPLYFVHCCGGSIPKFHPWHTCRGVHQTLTKSQVVPQMIPWVNRDCRCTENLNYLILGINDPNLWTKLDYKEKAIKSALYFHFFWYTICFINISVGYFLLIALVTIQVS